MLRAAQIAMGLVALFMLFLTVRFVFSPEAVATLLQSSSDGVFGTSNTRAQGATTLMLGILSAIAAVRMSWQFVVPAAVYFLCLIIIRIYSLIVDGYDPGIIRALALATVLFIITEVALQLFRRAERQKAGE